MDPSFLKKIEPVNKDSLQRLEAVFGVDPSALDQEGLERRSFEVFCDTTPTTYRSKLSENGLSIERPGDFSTDGTILFYILEKLYGKQVTGKDLSDYLTSNSQGSGYFSQEVIQGFKCGRVADCNIQLVWGDYHSRQEEASRKNACHKGFDAELAKSHRIAMPELLGYQLNFFDMPVDLSYLPDGRLAMLLVGEDCKTLKLAVEMVDYENQRASGVVWPIDPPFEELTPQFVGIHGSSTSFDGSLSVGSDGMMYIVSRGRVYRFDNQIGNRILPINEDSKIRNVLQAVRFDRSFPLGGFVYQVTEYNGSFFVSARQGLPDSGFHDTLFRVSRGKVVGSMPVHSSPGGIQQSGFHEFPKFSIEDGKVYIRHEGVLAGFDASLSKKAIAKPAVVLNPPKANRKCNPSNQCVDSLGRIWVVDQYIEEEASSIKCYSVEQSKTGPAIPEFLTHVYPENHPGGWPSLRKMAISPQGILAYSDCVKNCVNFYRLSGF